MKTLKTTKRQDAIFCLLILAYPLIQFSIFYVGVNASSVLMAFQRYDSGKYFWFGLDNFRQVIYNFGHLSELQYAVKNSLVAYIVGLGIGAPLSLLFSFFLYKNIRGFRFYRVMLFLPSVIPAIVLVLLYMYFVDRAIPDLHFKLFQEQKLGIVSNMDTAFAAVLFFNIFTSFGPKTLMYSSTMSGINDSVVESAKLDGASFMREFFSICLPMIYPTIVTFLVAGVAGIFTNQLSLFSFFGSTADFRMYTFGYYLYRNTQVAVSPAAYPYLSAVGLLMSLVAIPLTLVVRWLLLHYGPRTE